MAKWNAIKAWENVMAKLCGSFVFDFDYPVLEI